MQRVTWPKHKQVKTFGVKLYKKRQDILQFAKEKPLGIELGVAEGVFSSLVLENYDVEHWYSVDMWAGDRRHDVGQYRRAVKALIPYRHKNTILRMKFEEALPLFPDEYFDFVYVDGYAHTGQDDGKTLRDWWPKVKKGGVFAGDDYSDEWPETKRQVDEFLKKNNLNLNIFTFEKPPKSDNWSQSPSWYTFK
jgi:hypothetical protein